MNRVKLFSLTASLTLAIALTFSCSGSAGSDGINGTEGKDADCIFEPKPQTDTLLIICNDELVGTITNGKNGTGGTDGKDGADGADGNNGANGTDGKDGADGADGNDGANGINGKDGTDGADGKDGANGTDGKDGTDGADGKDGTDGQSCDVIDDDVYFAMICGGVEKARWAKAMCGAKAYDPANMECNNNALSFFFIDTHDNRKYKVVIIGSQTWMAENLKFADGGLCYNDLEDNCHTYGRLYNWETAKTVCPSGWHLPSDEEWSTLINFIDASSAGTKLKAKEGWNNDLDSTINGNGTDDYGFSALPGGYKSVSNFFSMGSSGYWWSSTETDTSHSSRISMARAPAKVNEGATVKTSSLSVRCIKD